MNFREIAAEALDEADWQDGDDFDESVFAEDAAVGDGQNKNTTAALEFDLQLHDRRFHKGHYDGKTECKYREKMAAAMGKAGLNAGDVQGLGTAGAAGGEEGTASGQPQEPSEAERKFLEIKAKFEQEGQTAISPEAFVKARNEYLLAELGETEAECIKRLEEAAKSDGPQGERAEAAAERILNDERSTTAQKEGAQAILDARKEWKINGKTYVDLSGMGFWEGLKEAFKAGYAGKDIVTDWDKMSGRWDAITASDPKFKEENGLLQEGVKDALADLGFGEDFEKAEKIEGLSREQWQEIGYLKYQYDQAESAKDKHAAWRKLKDYLKEQGLEKEKETPVTGGLADVKANFSGYAPDTDIYEPTPASETDDSFGKNLASEINDQLAKRKVAAKVTTYKDGSSIVQFRVERDQNNDQDKSGLKSLSDKQLQAVIADIAKDLGRDGQFSYSTASDGSKFTAFVRVNKPEARDAGLRRLLEVSKADEKLWGEIQKMRSPFLAGETAEGMPIWIDLKENGFIGGDPGSGKSERVRSGFAAALHVKTPNQLQLLVNAHANPADFAHLKDDPHLAAEVADSLEKVEKNYAIANAEWNRRVKLFAAVGARDIDHYNKIMRNSGKPEEQLPQLQVITDEITNLLQERPDLAGEIKKLTTNGRKYGVTHLGSTQDMGADNMPSEIKGASRFGVRSANPTSSDKIFGNRVQELRNIESKGGMLVRMPDGSIVRVRGTFAGDKNLEHLRDYNITTFKKGAGLSPEKPTAPASAAAPTSPTPSPTPTAPESTPTAPAPSPTHSPEPAPTATAPSPAPAPKAAPAASPSPTASPSTSDGGTAKPAASAGGGTASADPHAMHEDQVAKNGQTVTATKDIADALKSRHPDWEIEEKNGLWWVRKPKAAAPAAPAATQTVPSGATVTNLSQSQVKRAEALTQAQEAGVKAFQAAQPAVNAAQKAKLDGLLGSDSGFAEEG